VFEPYVVGGFFRNKKFRAFRLIINQKMLTKKPNVGGQAVIEGVMMKSPDYYSIAVRNDKGKIVTKREKLKKREKWMTFPFIRGIVNLIDMLVLGIKSLIWSANQFEEDQQDLTKKEVFITLAISIGFVILFFVALPYVATFLIGLKEEKTPVLFNLVDGIIKIVLFLAYLSLISLMKDVKTLFKYHGAEHKAVYCYEEGKELTIENVKKFSTKHPRCGTSFLLIVFIIAVLVFSLLPAVMVLIYPAFTSLNFLMRRLILFSVRILSIPIIAGVSYELLKLSDRFKDNIFVKILIKPGLWLQNITTKKPTNKQIEVAIKSLNLALSKKE